jgi:hypothetical protein
VNAWDPDGRKIRFANGSTTQFRNDVKAIIHYLNKYKISGVIADLEKDPNIIILKQGKKNDFYYDPKSKTIVFDSRSGLIVGKTKNGKNKVQTPALGFLHEASHALQNVTNKKQYINDKKTSVPNYDDKEEKRVIDMVETPAAKKAGEPTRKNHRGTATQVSCPTCDK